jgi:hypothetical protein
MSPNGSEVYFALAMDDGYRADSGPSRGDRRRPALRPEETFPPTHAVVAHGRCAVPCRAAGRVSAALLQFTFSIRAATSPQNAKRFFYRACFALRCSVSASFRAFASPS